MKIESIMSVQENNSNIRQVHFSQAKFGKSLFFLNRGRNCVVVVVVVVVVPIDLPQFFSSEAVFPLS